MVDVAQFEEFVIDKHDFFATTKTIEDARKRAYDGQHHYGFIAANEKLIREEFNLLLNRLKQDNVDQEIFWLYCYYCAILLQNYHRAYGQKTKENEFLKLRIQIKNHCINSKPRSNNDPFIVYLIKEFVSGLVDLVKTPTQTSKIRDKIGYGNINRIYWYFCRTILTKSLLLARDLHWLDKMGSLLGKNIDVETIISNLELPNSVLRGLSVGFFAARFIINAGTLIKHVYCSNKEERQLDWKKRFANEMYKRHGDFLNDLVWGTVNLLTNYNDVFHIAAPAAGWIVAGFLFFDVCLILWRRHLAEQEYETKRAQLLGDLAFYQNKLRPLPELTNKESEELKAMLKERAQYEEQCRITNEQLKSLDIKWQAENATSWFNAIAAFLLMAGFSASMVLTPAGLIIASYALCTFAVAMYLSADAYKSYKEKSLLFDQAKIEDKDSQQAMTNYNEARNDFYITMAKNTFMPTLVIGAYAICWQAALVLTLIYVGYQLYTAYNKHEEAKDSKEKLVEENSQGLELTAFA